VIKASAYRYRMVAVQHNAKESNSCDLYFLRLSGLKHSISGNNKIGRSNAHSINACAGFMVYKVLITVTKNTDCNVTVRNVNSGFILFLLNCIRVCIARLARIK
jgi:hypothetical protein